MSSQQNSEAMDFNSLAQVLKAVARPANLHDGDGTESARTDLDNEPANTDVGGNETTCTSIDGDGSARITSDRSNEAAVETIGDSKSTTECASEDNSKKDEAQTETVENKHARCEDVQDEYNTSDHVTDKQKAKTATRKDKGEESGAAKDDNTAPEAPKVVEDGSYIPGSPQPPTAEQLEELRKNVHTLFFFQISLKMLRQMGLPTSPQALEQAQQGYRKLAAELHRWEDKDKLPEWAGKPEDNFAMPGWA